MKHLKNFNEDNLLKNISWEDITISFSEGGFFTSYDVYINNIPDNVFKAKYVELNIKEGMFNQIHIELHDKIKGNNLTEKIYKATTHSLGHIFSSKGRRLNPIMDIIWDKLKNDGDTNFEVYENVNANICISADLPQEEKDILMSNFKKVGDF
jgi:hypothetical protein